MTYLGWRCRILLFQPCQSSKADDFQCCSPFPTDETSQAYHCSFAISLANVLTSYTLVPPAQTFTAKNRHTIFRVSTHHYSLHAPLIKINFHSESFLFRTVTFLIPKILVKLNKYQLFLDQDPRSTDIYTCSYNTLLLVTH